jgi:hypothetical protein
MTKPLETQLENPLASTTQIICVSNQTGFLMSKLRPKGFA